MSAAASAPDPQVWGDDPHAVTAVAHNVSTRYLAYLIDAVLGLVMLPFNLSHLGMAAYGLWMLTTSFTVYFDMLDLGYGGALVRFVARYRAQRDERAINEVLSTFSLVYAGIGAVAYVFVIIVALNLSLMSKLTPVQIETSRILLLIIGANVAARFAFGWYGGIIVGFQRYHLNNLTSIATSLATTAINVVVLLSGYGIVALVAATTTVRILSLLVYRSNAYRTFPGLSIKWSFFRRDRFREVSGFSIYMLLLDIAYKVNYSIDVIVVGAFLGAASVALWAPAQRLSDLALRLSNQLGDAIFPLIVDCDASQRAERLRRLFLEGTRLSLATVLPIGGGLAVMAQPLLTAWLGPGFGATAILLQVLAFVVIVRVGAQTASVVLKGAGMHRRLTLLVALMGLGNFGLSVALVGSIGLTGVAVGTAVPVAIVSLFTLFPAACHRVELGVGHVLRHGVWPAVWPAVVSLSALAILRPQFRVTLLSVALQLAVSAVIYFALFLIAVGSIVRRQYLRHVDGLLRRGTPFMRRIGTANAS